MNRNPLTATCAWTTVLAALLSVVALMPSRALSAEQGLLPPTNPDEINDRLANKRVAVKFDNVPLADAIEFLGAAAEVNTFLDLKALETIGVAADAPVTLKLRNPVSVGQAFRLVLRSINPSLNFNVDEEVVIITGSNDSQPPAPPSPPELNIRVYDVTELATTEAAGTALVQVVIHAVSPDAWKDDAAGPHATILGKRLVVNAPDETHEQIAELLVKLRHATPDGIVPEPEAKKEQN